MRPVNLIPPDARRGDRTPMRVGAVSYVVIAALAVGLLAMIALGFTSKQVSDRENEVAQLEQEEQEATARAESLKSFAAFRAMQESRTSTVASLAQSRFDWERVMNELALVIPSDVWLVQLAGTASPGVQLDEAPDISSRDSVAGPALEIVGCAPSQDAVAGFVADLEDIDGVTRVGIASSELPENDPTEGAAAAVAGAPAPASSDSGGENNECRTRSFITKFEIVVAFDEVPVPQGATSTPGVPAPVAPGGSGSQPAPATSPASSGTSAAQPASSPATGG